MRNMTEVIGNPLKETTEHASPAKQFEESLKKSVSLNRNRLVGSPAVIYGDPTWELMIPSNSLHFDAEEYAGVFGPYKIGEGGEQQFRTGRTIGSFREEIYSSLTIVPSKPLITRDVILPYQFMADSNRIVKSDQLDKKQTAYKNMMHNWQRYGRAFISIDLDGDPKLIPENDRVYQIWTETFRTDSPSTAVFILDGALSMEANGTAVRLIEWTKGLMKYSFHDTKFHTISHSASLEDNKNQKQLVGVDMLDKAVYNPFVNPGDRNLFAMYVTDGNGDFYANTRAGRALTRIIPKLHGFYYVEVRKGVGGSHLIDSVNPLRNAHTAVVRNDEGILGGLERLFANTNPR